MYDLQFVRKRRRRRIAALVSLVASIGVASLVIVSFLGRTVGTFTVAIKNTSVKLSLSETKAFEKPTSYLRIGNIPSTYDEFSYHWFFSQEKYHLDRIDDESNTYLYGLSDDKEVMFFLKYTFYVKNVGNTTAKYDMYINLEESVKSENGQTLDDTLRIMLFENDPDYPDNHEYEVYAKDVLDRRYTVINKKTQKATNQAFIAETPNPSSDGIIYEDDDHPLATSFLANKGRVAKRSVTNFKKNEMKKYTVVYWLEGEASFPEYDEDGNPIELKGAKIKLSIDITGSSYNIDEN